VDPEPALEVLDGFQALVRPVDGSVYESAQAEALARIERRDAADWPILATALVLGLPIWTEDQDFFGTGVPTWTTDRVELYLNAAGPYTTLDFPTQET
jgi:predicted nucleic acid-binding protein